MNEKPEPKIYKVPQLNMKKFPPIPGSVEWHKSKIPQRPVKRLKKTQ